MKKIALLALPFAGAALVLAAPAGAKPSTPPPPHPVQTLVKTAVTNVVGTANYIGSTVGGTVTYVVGQAERQINGTLYNLGYPYP